MRRPLIAAAASVTVVALGFGGTAVADAFITGKDVKDGSLTGADIKSGSITGADVKTNSITWSDIANGTVRSTEIRNGSIALKDMSDEALQQLTQGILGTLDQIGVFDALDRLDAADVAIKADVAGLKTDLTALAARVTAAEGTLADVVTDAAAIDARVTALDSRLDALENSALVDSNWGTILRNVIGSASATLRNGPASSAFGPLITPPMGTGSLQIDTANGQSKVAFGNEVDFAGKPVSALGSPSFSVYTTGENNTIGAGNLPNITIELNPDVAAKTYTSLVFVPTKAAVGGAWTEYSSDVATDGYWYFTSGPVATATTCGQANSCTLTQALNGLGANAKLYTVGVGKGRDSEFHGAVDALNIGNTTYDFEAKGVVAVTAAAAKKAAN